MSGSGQTLFRGFGSDSWSTPTWQNPSGAPPPGAGEPPPSGYVGPGSASGWTSDTSVPYQTTPMVNIQGESVGQPATQSAGFDWQGMTQGLVGGLLNVFRGGGQPQPQYQPPPSPGVPVWVWVAIPVALVGVIAIARRKPRLSGYRRRRSKR